MQIILLEKVVNLGNLGDIVKVKGGYARKLLIRASAHVAHAQISLHTDVFIDETV